MGGVLRGNGLWDVLGARFTPLLMHQLGHLGMGQSTAGLTPPGAADLGVTNEQGCPTRLPKCAQLQCVTQTLPMVLLQVIPPWKTTEALERGVGRGLTPGWVVPAVSDLC